MSEHFSLEFERAILGSILFNPDVLSDVVEILKPSDFYSQDNQDIFSAMLSLRAKNEPIDENFIKQELKNKIQNSVFEDILSSSVVNVWQYAKSIKEMSQKRQIKTLATYIPAIIEKDNILEVIDKINEKIYSIANNQLLSNKKTSKEAAELALEEIKRRKEEGNGLLGIDTGYKSLNFYTNGFKNGDFIIIAARPGMGKTTFALNIVEKVLENGNGVVFFSLEMPAEQLMFRMFSSLSSIEFNKILKGVTLDDNDLEKLSLTCDKISNFNFFIYDSGDISVHKIRTELRRLKEKNKNIELCVIDYIGLMTNSSNFSERHLQIAEISRSLKLLARELEMPIIALSQLNRGVESRANKRPQLSDLRESGAIEQDADMILFVYRGDFYKEQDMKEQMAKMEAEGKSTQNMQNTFKTADTEEAEIIIGKNRNGETGAIKMLFDKKHCRFVASEIHAIENNKETEMIMEF